MALNLSVVISYICYSKTVLGMVAFLLIYFIIYFYLLLIF